MDLIIQISLDNLDSRETQFENYFVFIGSLRNHIQTFKKAEQREPDCNIYKEEKNIVFSPPHHNISWNDLYLKFINLLVYWRHEVKKVCYLTCISNRLKRCRNLTIHSFICSDLQRNFVTWIQSFRLLLPLGSQLQKSCLGKESQRTQWSTIDSRGTQHFEKFKRILRIEH